MKVEKSKRYCAISEFTLQMEEMNLTEKLEVVMEWSKKIPDHEKYYSCKTNRISFRIQGDKKAFLTIVFQKNSFIYLLNGLGVNMNDMKNWVKSDYSLFQDGDFLEVVKSNYRKR